MSKPCQPTNDDLERWKRLATTTKLTHDPPISDPVLAHIRELENAVALLVADVWSRQKEDRKRRDDAGRHQDAIWLGSGTKVVADPPTMTVRGRHRHQPDTYANVQIVQHVVLTADVTMWSPRKPTKDASWTCGICGAMPPLPTDAASLEYVMRHNGGERLHFPDREDAEPSDSAYPVVGWRRRDDFEDIHLVCTACNAELDKALEKVVAKRRDTGTAEKP